MKSSTASRVFAALVRRSLSVAIFACCVAMLWANVAPAAINYNTVGGSYAQDFNSLPNSPTNASLGTSPAGWIDDTTTPGTNQFSILGWYLWHPIDLTATGEGGANQHQRLRASSGNSTTGAFYSFGTNSTTERALGMVSSNTLAAANAESYIGLRLTNNTGSTLGQFTLSYNGEEWRDGGNNPAVAQNLKLGYKVGAANVQDTGFTLVPSLQFTSPVNTTTAAAVDGNVAGRVAIPATTVSGFNWAPGTDLWLRWIDINDPNNDHGLAIDDVSFSANIIPTSTWNGTTNSDWNTASNWTGGVPVSSNIANFDNAGNGNTTISLGGTRPIGFIQFNAGAAAYTLGSSPEQFDVDAGGSITVASGVTSPQTVNAKINALGGLTISNSSTAAALTIGSDVTSSSALAVDSAGTVNVNGPVTNNGSLAVSGAGTATLNGVIGGTGALTSTMTGTLVTNAQHTYAGGANITVTTSTQPIVRIGASTVGAPGSVTAGPFGTGQVTISGATAPILQPTGSDITIANAISLPAGFFAATAPSAVDPTVRSLTFTGPITTVGARTITNNIVSGGTLTFGSAGSPSTLTLGGNLGLQTQFATSGAGGGVIVVNDQISGAFGLNVQNGATVTITNNNTNTGITNVQTASGQSTATALVVNNVPVNAGVDAGLGGGVAVKTGTLAGTGTIKGNSNLQENSLGAAHLAPGNGASTANGAGKLTFYNDLTFSAGGTGGVLNCVTCTFDVEVGGLTAGTQYDHVAVGGTLTIGDTTPRGILNVSLINGFTTPTSSTDFTIMTGSSVIGQFATVNLPDANWSIVYNPTSVVLHVAAAGLAGDYNSDGKVDAADYVLWRKTPDNYGGDPAGYNTWRQNFGNPPGSGSGLESGAVPEPGTIALLGTAMIALAYPRRRCYSPARFLD
jgi:hypothetical protein